MFAMRRRAFELGACSVEQQLLLFDIFVSPVLSYGCEMWGVDLLDRPDCASEVCIAGSAGGSKGYLFFFFCECGLTLAR